MPELSITLFGVLWATICIIFFFKKDIRYAIAVTLVGMLFQCNNIITINGNSVGPQILTSVLFIIRSIIFLCNNKQQASKKTHPFVLISVLLCLYILVNCIISGADIMSFARIVILLIYLFASVCMYKVGKFIDSKDISKMIQLITVLVLSVGFLQVILSYTSFAINPVTRELFYNEVNNAENLKYYGGSHRFYSLFMEPSYAACILVALLIYYVYNDKEKYSRYFIALLLVAIFLSASSTAYIMAGIAFLIYSIKNIRKRSTWVVIALLAFVILIIGTFTNLLDGVIFEKLSSDSGITRSRLDGRAMEVFSENILIGNGYGTTRASSIITTILAELGLIGAALYVMQLLSIAKHLFSKDKRLFVASNIFICAFTAQIIACPDLYLSSFWFLSYIFMIIYANSTTAPMKDEKIIADKRHEKE